MEKTRLNPIYSSPEYFDLPGHPVEHTVPVSSVPALAEVPFFSADQRPPVQNTADQRPPVQNTVDQPQPLQDAPEPPFLRAMRDGDLAGYLNPVDFCAFLAHLGYRRYLGNGHMELVKACGHVVERIGLLKAKEDVEAVIAAQDFNQGVKDRVYKRTKEFFKATNLTSLPEFEGEFWRDSAELCVKVYLNCAVKIGCDRIETFPLDKLDRYVWAEDIIPRGFKYDPNWREGIYYRFTRNQCSDPQSLGDGGQPVCDEDRHHAYLCSIGYNLHGFKSRLQPCLTIYSDATDGDRERQGGSGKSMIIQLLTAMQGHCGDSDCRVVQEAGESLKRDYNHNFDRVTKDTRVVVIDDLDTRNFRLEDVYSWVSTGMKVNKKGQTSQHLSYEESPKCVITSNNPVSGTRDSDLRRRMDVQLHRFYNARRKPVHDFGRGFFKEGFNTRDWNQFDCFALHCIHLSLSHKVATQGLPAYKNNVMQTSLEMEAGEDLVEYLDKILLARMEQTGEVKIDARQTKLDYEEEYGVRRKESSLRFNQRLKRYAELHGWGIDIKPSGGVNMARFTLAGRDAK